MALGAITRRRCHLIDMPAANQGSSPLQSAAQAEQTAVYLLTHLDQVPHYILAKRYEELACFADYLHADVPPVLLDKHLMLQILINLISNAKQAMNGSTQQPHQIKLKVDIAESAAAPRLRIRIEDNGEGIAPENLTRLFAHGFTTRKSGHGFGLHSSALAVKEMKGNITAFSEGLGRGAAFVLELPVNRVAESA